MSFFSFRRGRTSKPKAGVAAATESVEVVRRRARQRLIGAAVLVLLGVIGFPLLFDSQPRPVPVDIAIEIPSRSAIKPGSPIPAVPSTSAVAPPVAPPVAPAPVASAEPAPAQPVAPQASLEAKEEIVSGKVANPPAAAAPEAAPKAERSDGQRARELLDGKPAAQAAASDARVVVQVGAFADLGKAREVRQKLEKAGLKTYTQVIETKEGKRTRVRVGPFANRTEAEQAAAKIKALDLPASILVL